MSAPFIPPSAPFNDEQRAWLNGFFAGLFGVENGVPAIRVGMQSSVDSSQRVPEQTKAIGASAEDHPAGDEEPWHDGALGIDERMQLASSKPLPQRLMAAMAQLDCGACGYVCRTYSAAIAEGREKNLTLCSPGGSDTTRMLRQLLKESEMPAVPNQASLSIPAADTSAGVAADIGYSREKPFVASIKAILRLNAPSSAKDTRHVIIDLGESGLRYRVGDALGIYPINPPELVDMIMNYLELDDSNSEIRERLMRHKCLNQCPDELLQLCSDHDAEDATLLGEYLAKGVPAGMDVLELLETLSARTGRSQTQALKLPGAAFANCLQDIRPRLYSIASSPASFPNEVHLTVGRVAYERSGRTHFGVCSTMLSDRMHPNDAVRVFVQPNHTKFTVPDHNAAPMIMIGPGTGIAPFIAFLQEREQRSADGKNWLFFGDQHQSADFLYESQLRAWQDNGLLTRLSLAFSRDQANKVYVQDQMRLHGKEFWKWLEQGAFVFVCGDAKHMAKDVDIALREIIAVHGKLPAPAVDEYIGRLRKEHRYVRDVY